MKFNLWKCLLSNQVLFKFAFPGRSCLKEPSQWLGLNCLDRWIISVRGFLQWVWSVTDRKINQSQCRVGRTKIRCGRSSRIPCGPTCYSVSRMCPKKLMRKWTMWIARQHHLFQGYRLHRWKFYSKKEDQLLLWNWQKIKCDERPFEMDLSQLFMTKWGQPSYNASHYYRPLILQIHTPWW